MTATLPANAHLQSWLDRFARLARPAHGYRWSFHHDGDLHPFHIVVSGMIHGDEVGSLPAIVRVCEALANGQLHYGGRLTLLIGNPEAGLADARFLEHDLNRVFTKTPPQSHEGQRAQAILPILHDADLLLDLHQTILPTAQPFYICAFERQAWRWARALAAAKVWVTRSAAAAFSTGAMCTDELVRVRGGAALTLELSEKGFDHGAEPLAEAAIRSALSLADQIAAGSTTLQAAADAQPELGFYQTAHREPFADATFALRPGLVNFQPVQRGQPLHADGHPALKAPQDGALLFPKYPPRRADGAYKTPLPGEIYRIIEPMDEHPDHIWP